MSFIKECVLTERECKECGECNICDLNPDKICDNCCKCIEIDADYKSVEVEDILEDDESIILDAEDLENWKYEEDYVVDYSDEEEEIRRRHR